MSDARNTTSTVAAVINPVKGDVIRVRESIARYASDSNAGEPLWFETTEDDDGGQAAAEAAAAGVKLVIASGGDGTVRSVAAALRNTGAALGIVPSGTGNLLARNLGIPIGDPEAAIELAFNGADRVVDVGLAEFISSDGEKTEHPFMVVAGVGVDAAMVANTSSRLKERLGWIAYVDGVLRSVFVSKPTHTRLHVARPNGEDTLRSFDAHSVLVGNVGALPGGVELLPGALIDDGELDVAVMHPKTVFGWLYIGRAVMWENQILRRTSFGRKMMSFRSRVLPNVLEYTRGPVVSLKLDQPLDAELDGDAFGLVTAARFRTDARSLIVKVPADVTRVP